MNIGRPAAKGDPSIEKADRLPGSIERVAGSDVAYEIGGDRWFAAIVTLDARSLSPIETGCCEGREAAGYVPGQFALRELPPLLAAFGKLTQRPDLLICDGHGVAHPRRYGLACQLGVRLDIPTIGCAKSCLIGQYKPPGPRRGDRSLLIDDGEVIGMVLRTRDGTRPLFVSTGHRISPETACDWVLRLAPQYRQPEPIRRAHAVATALRAGQVTGVG